MHMIWAVFGWLQQKMKKKKEKRKERSPVAMFLCTNIVNVLFELCLCTTIHICSMEKASCVFSYGTFSYQKNCVATFFKIFFFFRSFDQNKNYKIGKLTSDKNYREDEMRYRRIFYLVTNLQSPANTNAGRLLKIQLLAFCNWYFRDIFYGSKSAEETERFSIFTITCRVYSFYSK